jgi:hypothetical protein
MHFTTDVREEGFSKEDTKEEIFTAEAQSSQSSERRGIFTTKEVTKEEIFTAEAQVVRKNPFMLRGPQHEREV